MSRNILFSIFACLLCLLPDPTHAQSLIQYEYWYDDDVSSRQQVSISGTDAVINTQVSTEGLSPGLHRFNFRVRRSDGEYSPVTSSIFLKGVTQGKRLEYWFDDDFDNRDFISISDTEEEQSLDLNLCDVSKFPLGFHKFNMRLAMGGYSPVYTAYVLKLSSGAPTKIEYWVDDDYEHRQWVTGHPSASGDNDYVYVDPFDLSKVGPGLHRIYYRATSENGITSSPVSMTPVLVKSRYSASSGGDAGTANAKMTQYSIAVDNEAPVLRKFSNPDYDVTLDDAIDMHNLAPGQHTVKASFWNNLGAGVSHQAQFTVTVPEIQVPHLTATEKDGIVQIVYDIPANQHHYQLMRQDGNGATASLSRHEIIRGHEVNSNYTDLPPVGSYTYYVKSAYYDNDGVSHSLTSNKVTVDIAQAQSDLNNCGHIYGWLTLQPGSDNSWLRDIVYSDGVENTVGDTYFKRENIPVGTTLTISANGRSDEDFEPVTITIKRGDNFVHLVDKNRNVYFETKPNHYNNDLQFCSDLEWVGNSYQFTVKNVTRYSWGGYVRLRIITKDKALKEKLKEQEGGEGATDPTEEEDYDEITPGLRAEDNYVYVYSDKIKTLNSGESTTVTLSLDNVFAPDKSDWYYIYFESFGKWNLDPEGSEKVKDIGIDNDYSITENPMLRKINKKDLKLAVTKELMQDAEYGANIILACCSKLDQLNGIIGNMGDKGWVELSKMYKEKYPIDLMDLNQYIDEAIETGSAAEFKQDRVMQEFLFYLFGYNCLEFANKFREDIANDIFKYSKGVEDYLGKAMKVLKYIRDYRTWKQMNDYERFFYCADAILDAADRYTDTPICTMLKSYTKIGRSLIQKALEYGATYYENYAGSFLKENAPSQDDNPKRDYNRHIDFKIKVRANYWMDFFGYEYFNFEENGTSPIREVVVKAHNIPAFPNSIATLFFDLVPLSDGVMLKQTSIDNENALDDQKPIDKMWMEIKWKNGRTTIVPLRADIDGVDFELATLGQPTNLYTVYLQSGVTKFSNMADDIEIKK